MIFSFADDLGHTCFSHVLVSDLINIQSEVSSFVNNMVIVFLSMKALSNMFLVIIRRCIMGSMQAGTHNHAPIIFPMFRTGHFDAFFVAMLQTAEKTSIMHSN